MKIILLTSTVKVVCNRTFYSNTGNRPTTTKLCKLYTDCQSVEVVNMKTTIIQLKCRRSQKLE